MSKLYLARLVDYFNSYLKNRGDTDISTGMRIDLDGQEIIIIVCPKSEDRPTKK